MSKLMRSAVAGLPDVWPVSMRSQSCVPIGAEVGSFNEVTMTADASAHTKGAWVEVITSVAAIADWTWVHVRAVSSSSSDTSALMDIGVGGSGSEVPVVNNIPIGSAGGLSFILPLRFLTGERIACRMQSITGGRTGKVGIQLASSAVPGGRSPRYLDTYGVDTATSTAVNVPTSDTYVEITSATTQPYAGLIPIVSIGGAVVSQATVIQTTAVGASGSEVALGTGTWVTTTAEQILSTPQNALAGSPFGGLVAHHIPAGTRIAGKHAVGRTYAGVGVLAVPYA